MLMQGNLDVRDAAVNTLLQEVATLLQLLVKQGGEPLIQQLASTVIPQLPLPVDLQVTPVFISSMPASLCRSRASSHREELY